MNRTTAICVGLISVVALFGFALYCGVYAARRTAELATVNSNLGHLGINLRKYRDTNRRLPRSLSELKDVGVDWVSKKPYAYFPDAGDDPTAVLVAQSEPFRTAVWPFGRTMQMGLRADGMVVDLVAQGEKAFGEE